jgi:hypothetical protein
MRIPKLGAIVLLGALCGAPTSASAYIPADDTGSCYYQPRYWTAVSSGDGLTIPAAGNMLKIFGPTDGGDAKSHIMRAESATNITQSYLNTNLDALMLDRNHCRIDPWNLAHVAPGIQRNIVATTWDNPNSSLMNRYVSVLRRATVTAGPYTQSSNTTYQIASLTRFQSWQPSSNCAQFFFQTLAPAFAYANNIPYEAWQVKQAAVGAYDLAYEACMNRDGPHGITLGYLKGGIGFIMCGSEWEQCTKVANQFVNAIVYANSEATDGDWRYRTLTMTNVKSPTALQNYAAANYTVGTTEVQGGYYVCY